MKMGEKALKTSCSEKALSDVMQIRNNSKFYRYLKKLFRLRECNDNWQKKAKTNGTKYNILHLRVMNTFLDMGKRIE